MAEPERCMAQAFRRLIDDSNEELRQALRADRPALEAAREFACNGLWALLRGDLLAPLPAPWPPTPRPTVLGRLADARQRLDAALAGARARANAQRRDAARRPRGAVKEWAQPLADELRAKYASFPEALAALRQRGEYVGLYGGFEVTWNGEGELTATHEKEGTDGGSLTPDSFRSEYWSGRAARRRR